MTQAATVQTATTATPKPKVKRTPKKVEGTVTVTIQKVDYVSLMERAVTGEKDRVAMQQVIDGLIKPLEVAGAPEMAFVDEADQYIEWDTKEQEAKANKEALRVQLFKLAAQNEVVKFRVDPRVSLLVVDSSSSKVDTSLLTPAEQVTYETLKAKATVKSPVLALKRSK